MNFRCSSPVYIPVPTPDWLIWIKNYPTSPKKCARVPIVDQKLSWGPRLSYSDQPRLCNISFNISFNLTISPSDPTFRFSLKFQSISFIKSLKICPLLKIFLLKMLYITFTANQRAHLSVCFFLWLNARCSSKSELIFLSVNLFSTWIIMS